VTTVIIVLFHSFTVETELSKVATVPEKYLKLMKVCINFISTFIRSVKVAEKEKNRKKSI